MIACEEALAHVLAHARPLPPERLELKNCRGRYLAREVAAREAIPRFDQSAVDGYGIRAAELAGATGAQPVRLQLAGEIRAGDAEPIRNPHFSFDIPHSAFRIYTGAPIPHGVDAVVMKEVCTVDGDGVLVGQAVPAGANIRRRGEEFAEGQPVLAAGTRLTPPVVGLLATLGCARPSVHRLPRVALIVTGNELRAPGEPLKAGQIRDSNSFSLAAALEASGFAPASAARVRDDLDAIRHELGGALTRSDVVLTVGGVSVGDYDFVKEAAAALAVETVYWKVAIKPGMPNYFGIQLNRKCRPARTKLLFGLPGNPVAALVSFQLFVRPALLALAGAPAPRPRFMKAALTRELRKKHGRLEWVRGVLDCQDDTLTVTPTGGQESHMLGGLAAADCLIDFPAERVRLDPGETVRVIPLQWEVGCGVCP